MAIATKDKNNGRQWPLVARQPFDFSQLEDGVAVEAIELPVGAIVLSGSIVVTEAFDSGTSDALAVSGGGVTSAAFADAQTPGIAPAVVTGAEQTLGDTVDITWSPVGTAATAGAGYLEVMYIITSRANENQP